MTISWIWRFWFPLLSTVVSASALAAPELGKVAIVHAFHHLLHGADGADPQALTQVPDGALYGVTVNGGLFGGGTIFRIDPQGNFGTLYSFRGPEGLHPADCLVAAADGLIYGTTPSSYVLGGVASAPATLFRIDSKGKFAQVFVFPRDPTIEQITVMVRGIDGNMYAEGPNLISGEAGVGRTFQLVGQRLGTMNWPDFRISPPGMYLSNGFDSLEQFQRTQKATGGVIPPDIGEWRPPAPGEARQFQRRAICGIAAATSDGHTLLGAARSISRNPAFGLYSLVPPYVRVDRDIHSNPNYPRLGEPVGPPAEGSNGVVYLASTSIPEPVASEQEHTRGGPPATNPLRHVGILSINVNGQVTLVAQLDAIGWPVFGLTPTSSGYFYGLAGGTSRFPAAVYRFRPGGPIEVVYTFPAAERRFAGPLIETRDGVFYGTLGSLRGSDDGQIFKLEIASHQGH